MVWVKALDMVLECVGLSPHPQHTRRVHTAGAFVEGPLVRSGWEIQPNNPHLLWAWEAFSGSSTHLVGGTNFLAGQVSPFCPLTQVALTESLPRLERGQDLPPPWLLGPSLQTDAR